MTRRLMLSLAVLLLCMSMFATLRQPTPVLSVQAVCTPVRVVTLDSGSAQHHAEALRSASIYLHYKRAAESVTPARTASAHFHRIAAEDKP